MERAMEDGPDTKLAAQFVLERDIKIIHTSGEFSNTN